MPLVSFNDDKDVTSTFNATDVSDGVWFNKFEAGRIAEDCATMPGTDYAFRWNEAIECFETTEETDDGLIWVAVKSKVCGDGEKLFRMGEDWEWRTVPRPDEDPEDEWQTERVEDWDVLATSVIEVMSDYGQKRAAGDLHYEIGSW